MFLEALAIEPKILNFGQVALGNTSERTFRLTATGSAPVVVSSVDIAPNSGSFALLGDIELPHKMVPAEMLDVHVRFSPSAAGQAVAEAVVLASDNAPVEWRVQLEGEGTRPDKDGDGYDMQSDCNDNDQLIHPGAIEVCDDHDNDCDNFTDENFVDSDVDSVADCVDPCPLDVLNDHDRDGHCEVEDVCPDQADADQSDADGDGVGDACDACPADAENDSDTDGVCAPLDNCLTVDNPEQENTDGDSEGDACDPCPLDNPNYVDGSGTCSDGIPPDPSWIASAATETVATDFATTNSFLYSGNDPVQTGMDPLTIDPSRASVLRGRVLDEWGAPLGGVRVTVHAHPEFGETRSRIDGIFDLVVNGGSTLSLSFDLAGYIHASRKLRPAWLDFSWAEDVAMVSSDPVVTELHTAIEEMQVAEGSVVWDEDGSRQAVVIFPPFTSATAEMGNGTSVPLSSLTVRATEFTVGDIGIKRMPAQLPLNSAYTYAVELSVDEADAMGATSVQFDTPLPLYVENFVGFPVGERVPCGYFDRNADRWVASESGIVLAVVAIQGGRAELDLDGDGVGEAQDELEALGILQSELEELARRYPPGQSLWRVRVSHFTTWDLNWGFLPPDDAETCACQPEHQPETVEPQCQTGSIIDCHNQVLGEKIHIVGTDVDLSYTSDRQRGRLVRNSILIPISLETVPESLLSINLRISVAGQLVERSFEPLAQQSVSYTWDGYDAYGRRVQGQQDVSVDVGYVYKGQYQGTNVFGYSGNGVPITGDREQMTVTLWTRWKGKLGYFDDARHKLGGWTLSPLHVYDPTDGVLYLGSGSTQSVEAIGPVVGHVAGGGIGGDGGPAAEAGLAFFSPWDLTTDGSGSIYFVSWDECRIKKIDQNGILSTVAGTYCEYDFHGGDGGPATQANLNAPRSVAVDREGRVYIGEAHRVSRVDSTGIIETIAGTGRAGCTVGAGLSADLYHTLSLAVDVDDNLLISDRNCARVVRLSSDGMLSVVAGVAGRHGYRGDGGPAAQAYLYYPERIATDADGNTFIADSYNYRVRKVTPEGIVSTYAGTGQPGDSGDGGPATDATLNYPYSLALDDAGSLYIGMIGNGYGGPRIRRIDSAGVISGYAGSGSTGLAGDGGPARKASFGQWLGALSVAPGGELLVGDTYNRRIRRVSSPDLVARGAVWVVPDMDGSVVYEFDREGRHLATVDAITGATKNFFVYDEDGLISSMTDGFSKTIRVERDQDGYASAIVGPFGQRTELEVDENGYLLRVENPAGETIGLSMNASGLLLSRVEPAGTASATESGDYTHHFTYDESGRLLFDENPDGSSTRLSRESNGRDFVVTERTALGRTRTLEVTHSTEDEEVRVTTEFDGSESGEVRESGHFWRTLSNHNMVDVEHSPDPRWGMISPSRQTRTVSTPSGLRYVASVESEVDLSDPEDPLSVTQETTRWVLNGAVTTSTYEVYAGEEVTTSAEGRQIVSKQDARGLVTSVRRLGQVPDGFGGSVEIEPVTHEWDSIGRLVGTDQGSRTISYRYHEVGGTGAGMLSEVITADGASIRMEYDDAGRVISVELPAEYLEQPRRMYFTYDAQGRKTSISPPDRPAYTLSYTEGGRLAGYSPPVLNGLTSMTRVAYDRDGNVQMVELPDGSSMQYTYDEESGQLLSVTDLAGETVLSYDPTTGQTVGIQTPEMGLSMGWDGHLVTTMAWNGLFEADVKFVYNNDFRVVEEWVNGAQPIMYDYDMDGILRSAGDYVAQLDADTGVLAGSSVGSVSEVRGYDGLVRLALLRTSFEEAAIYALEVIDRDIEGRILAKQEIVEGISRYYSYHYDAAGRLDLVSENGENVLDVTYDSNGNLAAFMSGQVALDSSQLEYDARDRLLRFGSLEFDYDAMDRLRHRVDVSDGTVTVYEYGSLGELRGVILPDGTLIEYVLDGANRRVGKRVNGQFVKGWIYKDDRHVVAELDRDGRVHSRFVYGSNSQVPEYLIRGESVFRIVSDPLGSPRLVVDVESGVVAQRMDHDAIGRVSMDSAPGFQPFGFAGGLYDPDTGLVRFGERDYDAETGRWTAPDPILFDGWGGNLYMYANGDPVNRRDPSGLSSLSARSVAEDAYDRCWGSRSSTFRRWGPLSNVRAAFDNGSPVCIDYAEDLARCLNADPTFSGAGLVAEGTWRHWRQVGFKEGSGAWPPETPVLAHADVAVYAIGSDGVQRDIATFDPWWRLW